MDALHKVLLHDEHMLLGAELALGSDGRHAPHSYAGVDERAAFHEGVALIDLSGLGSRLITGPTAPALASTVFAGRELAIGEVAPEVALTGDGSIASLALVARTGTEELACWDLAGRGDILSSWLAFVAGIEQRGVRPFDGCEVEDASEALVPLLLWGPQASNVLSDYLGEQTVPGKGTVANRTLDRIGCLVATPDFGETPCHLVLVPPLYARVLWRSFLSFQSVSPVGMRALVREVASHYPFLAPAEGEDRLTATRQKLAQHGLLRSEPTFIGARGLS